MIFKVKSGQLLAFTFNMHLRVAIAIICQSVYVSLVLIATHLFNIIAACDDEPLLRVSLLLYYLLYVLIRLVLLVDLLDELHRVKHVVIVRLERKLLVQVVAHGTVVKLVFREHRCVQLLVIIMGLERIHDNHVIIV